MPQHAILIATLASKAQLITLALDCLYRRREPPQRLVIVHACANRLETRQALERLGADLPIHFPELQFESRELTAAGLPLQDVTSPAEVDAAFRALYAEARAAKLRGERIHLLISGGRRVLTVFGMAVAQMLFDDEDRLWHLDSHPALEASGNLHAEGEEWARLIPIPVITWGRLSPVFDSLRDVTDPLEAARRLERLRLREQWDAARIFLLAKVTPAERETLDLLGRHGLTQAEIAEKLCLSPRTVEQHLRAAYRKAADHWQVEDVNQMQLARLLSAFYHWEAG